MKKKKKNFSARKIIPPCGQTDSSQRGIHAHISGSGKFFPWLWPHFPLPLTILNASAQCSHYLQISKGSAASSLPKRQIIPLEMMAFQLEKKTQGFPEKVLLLLCPNAILLSSLLILNNLVLISHITEIGSK